LGQKTGVGLTCRNWIVGHNLAEAVLQGRDGIFSATLITFCERGVALVFKRAFTFCMETNRTMAQSTSEFEQLVAAIRQRVRTNGARLFADWLRSYVGLVCGETNTLLNKHIHEVGLQPGHAANAASRPTDTKDKTGVADSFFGKS
jgi:hypothetical protein